MNSQARNFNLKHAMGAGALLGLVLLFVGCSTGSTEPVTPATSQQFAFWPPYPDEPRIQFLASYQHSGQIAQQKANALADIVYGKDSNPDEAVNKPYGVEMWNGRIYVCDLRGAAVMVFDLRNKQTRLMGITGNDILVQPSDIAIAEDGTKYVSDIGRNLVFVYDANERFVTTFGMKDFKPTGLAVFGDRLYVANFVAQRIEIFNRLTGAQLGHFGERGDGNGKFVRPLGVAVDREGNVYVTDVIRCKLQKFSPEGEFLLSFGTITNNIGALVRPKHVAVDPEGIIYIVDAAFQNVQVFSPEGDILTFFGAAGRHPGAMYLPVGVAIHHGDLDLFKQFIHPGFEPQYLILVTNQFTSHKVSVYAFGNLRSGVTVEDIKASQADINLGVSDADELEDQGLGEEPIPDENPTDPNG